MPTFIDRATLEETMTDVDSVTKKTLEHKRHPRGINILKKLVGATIITKCILDLGVSLTVGELLASAPAVEKQLTKAISEDEAVQFSVSLVDIDNPTHINNY